jgi:hypothetical protein
MTTDTAQPTAEVSLPTQRRPFGAAPLSALPEPGPETEPPPDHVRRHPRTCYWDVAECRWRCSDA